MDKFPANDLKDYPHMTVWFNLPLLSRLLMNVIVSELFGQYADRRLIVAALDKDTEPQLVARAHEFSNNLAAQSDGSLWMDYVADLGDGFDATYAIATIITSPSFSIDTNQLPRGELLIMGGDEVYPTASPVDYRRRTRMPYSAAFPPIVDTPRVPSISR